ncbi:MAG: NrsF family protein [Rhizobiaceae bacterium]
MKTEDLIKAISADSARQPLEMRRVWLAAFGGAILIAALIFFAFMGPRPDFAQAVETTRFLFKFAVTGALLVSAVPVLRALARPGERPAWPVMLAAPALILAAIAMELVALPSRQWFSSLVGTNAFYCLTLIPLLGIGPLAAMLAALRAGAPTRPVVAGAVAGVAAGGLAAIFYAAYCTDDSPLFVATWYSLAILLLAVLGALAGRVVLRW